MSGLHISLGVFLKFFELLLDACTQHELQIAAKEAESDGNTGKTEYDVYVQTLRKSLQEKKTAEALLAEAQAAQDYASYIVTLGGTELSQANHAGTCPGSETKRKGEGKSLFHTKKY